MRNIGIARVRLAQLLITTLVAAGLVVGGPLAGPASAAEGFSAIATGGDHSCGVTTSGGVKCWGSNLNGQLGDGSTTDRSTPVDVAGLGSGVSAIAVGNRHSCAVTTAGGVKCWGFNTVGELGDGTTTDRSTPVDVSGLGSGVSAVSLGIDHSCALTTAGGVKCWGYNLFGQLGDGTATSSSSPVDVVGLGSGVAAIAAGGFHSCAVTTSGGVECWGNSQYGQLGDGTTTDSSTPVGVVGLGSGVAAISAGRGQSCAVTIVGAVKCWGNNQNGQAGDGTGIDQVLPVDVVGLGSGVTAIAAGQYHTCGLTTSGGVTCWGRNLHGALGDGTTTGQLTPAGVSGLTSGVAAISAGGGHSCALTIAGGVECWGDNASGQLGDGTTIERLTPVAVQTAVGPTSAALTVNRTGAGGGSVASSSPGIDCGVTCSADFAVGSEVTLTATPDAGSTFSGWIGECFGVGTCVLTMDTAKSVTATFSPVATEPPLPFLTAWGTFGTGNGQFFNPHGVAVDGAGNVFVVDFNNNRVQKFNRAGTFLTSWGASGSGNGQFTAPSGVAVDPSGNVFVADVANHRIQKFDNAGNFLSTWGTLGSGPGRLRNPFGVAVDGSGNVFVTDYGDSVGDDGNFRVQKFDNAGNFLTGWGTFGSGTGQLDHPVGIAVDASGNVFVVDVGNQRIEKFDGAGNFLDGWGTFGQGNGQFYYPFGVADDAAGNVFVTDASGRIQKFDNVGNFLTTWGSFGTGPGQFSNATGVAVDGSSNVIVADLGNHRIQRFGVAAADVQDPEVTVTTPVNSASYTVDQVVVASYSCTDAGGSGLVTCAGTVPSGTPIDTSSAGSHTFTVDATDGAGNATSTTTTYDVLAGNLSRTVIGGETLTTDPGGLGASIAVPVQTSVAVPVGVSGLITVTPQPLGPPPTGIVLFGTAIAVTAPLAPNATTPYEATFTIDAGVLGGISPDDVQAFRNGTPVPVCSGVTGAAPDPCVAARGFAPGGSGDAIITVRTTQFSVWTFGRSEFSVTATNPNSRARGVVHQSVTISGTGFVSGSTATFLGGGITVHSTTFVDASHLVADISITNAAALGSRDVRVSRPGAPVTTTTCGGCFTVTARPTITALTPAARPQGAVDQAVTITGTNLAPDAVVTFSGEGIIVNSVSGGGTSLVASVSLSASALVGARAVTITNPDGGVATRANAFTVSALPSVTSVVPGVVPQGRTLNVQLLGSGFPANFTTGGTVSFGPSIAVNTVTRNSATRLTVNITVAAASALGARDVQLTNPDGGSATCTGCFTVTEVPTIASLAPSALGQAASHRAVVVTGTGFQQGVRASNLGVGITVHSVTVNSATTLTLDVSVSAGAALGARNLTLTNPDNGTTTCVGCFTVVQRPTVNSVSPNSRPAGGTYTVAVNGVLFQAGATVSFSGAGIQVDSVTGSGTSLSVTITIAPDAIIGTRNITVTNPDGGAASRANIFRILAAL